MVWRIAGQERAEKTGRERAEREEKPDWNGPRKPDRNGLGVGKSRTGMGWEWGKAGQERAGSGEKPDKNRLRVGKSRIRTG